MNINGLTINQILDIVSLNGITITNRSGLVRFIEGLTSGDRNIFKGNDEFMRKSGTYLNNLDKVLKIIILHQMNHVHENSISKLNEKMVDKNFMNYISKCVMKYYKK